MSVSVCLSVCVSVCVRVCVLVGLSGWTLCKCRLGGKTLGVGTVLRYLLAVQVNQRKSGPGRM